MSRLSARAGENGQMVSQSPRLKPYPEKRGERPSDAIFRHQAPSPSQASASCPDACSVSRFWARASAASWVMATSRWLISSAARLCLRRRRGNLPIHGSNGVDGSIDGIDGDIRIAGPVRRRAGELLLQLADAADHLAGPSCSR